MGEEFGLPRISTGDMFREALESNTPLGNEAKQYMDRGELVPDDVTVRLVEQRLNEEDARDGFILDGFPRNLPQARILADKLAELGRPLDAAIYINVPQEESIRRISERRVCSQCGTTYSRDQLQGEEPRCGVCGGPLVQRQDDSEETARFRLEVYLDQTEPVVQFYKDAGLLIEIDGLRPIEDVFQDIVNALGVRRDETRVGGDTP